jgi:predicted lipoprotein with Yx(FWY)xxD motif
MGVRTPLIAFRIGRVAVVAAGVAVLAAGCGGSAMRNSGVAGARHMAKAATVQTRKVGKLGTILVNSRGLTLYMFEPDHQKRVTCKGSCLALWPLLKLKKGQKPTAGGAAKKSLLGMDGLVVTYNRWPLYTYVGDRKPGQATGQRLNQSGGLWYVLSPSGKVITKKP